MTKNANGLYIGQDTQIQGACLNAISSIPPGSTGFWQAVKMALQTVGYLDLGFQGHLLQQDSKVILSVLYTRKQLGPWNTPGNCRAVDVSVEIYSSLLVSKRRMWILNAHHQGAGWADSNLPNRWTRQPSSIMTNLGVYWLECHCMVFYRWEMCYRAMPLIKMEGSLCVHLHLQGEL